MIKSPKPLLYKGKKICRNSELNQGHRDFQSLALPTELLRHFTFIQFSKELVEQALRLLNSFSFRFTPLKGAIAAYYYSVFKRVGRASSTFIKLFSFRFTPLKGAIAAYYIQFSKEKCFRPFDCTRKVLLNSTCSRLFVNIID